jgi:sulfite reductase beta subunit-like hemoprotein
VLKLLSRKAFSLYYEVVNNIFEKQEITLLLKKFGLYIQQTKHLAFMLRERNNNKKTG